MDAPLSIQLKGVAPDTHVTIKSSIGTWKASATFARDAHGIVNLDTQAPVSGSYSVADPMRLVWSATPTGKGWFNRNKAPESFSIAFEALVDDQVITSARLERQILVAGVKREEIHGHGLFGTLFLPAGAGHHPVITLVSGSAGGLSEHAAALFSARGIASFSLAYFNFKSLPRGLGNIPLEYFKTTFNYLQSRGEIDRDRLAIMGGRVSGVLRIERQRTANRRPKLIWPIGMFRKLAHQ
jgi:hypothetical protein